MKNKQCLMDERYSGLTDIIINVSIAKHLIDRGYVVHWPVYSNYNYSLLKEYIKIDGLIWYSINDDRDKLNTIPYFKDLCDERPIFLRKSIKFPNGDLYLAIMEDSIRTECPMVMAAKFFWAKEYLSIPFVDWRKKVEIKRNLSREKELIKKYNLFGDYALVNNVYSYQFSTEMKLNNINYGKVHILNHKEDWNNGFKAFDWIGAIENAKEIHAVNSLIACLADKYATSENIYLYDRGETRKWHQDASFVFRNPNWILE